MEFRIKFDRPLIRSSDSLSSLSASSSFLTATAAKAFASPPSASASSRSLLTSQSATFQPPPETKASAMCPSFPGGNPPCFVPDKELNGGSSEGDASGVVGGCGSGASCGSGGGSGSSSGSVSCGGSSSGSSCGSGGGCGGGAGKVVRVPGLAGGAISRPEGCPPLPPWVPTGEKRR
ncbi:unnamed protein product [Closterium sp. NIES-53]